MCINQKASFGDKKRLFSNRNFKALFVSQIRKQQDFRKENPARIEYASPEIPQGVEATPEDRVKAKKQQGFDASLLSGKLGVLNSEEKINSKKKTLLGA